MSAACCSARCHSLFCITNVYDVVSLMQCFTPIDFCISNVIIRVASPTTSFVCETLTLKHLMCLFSNSCCFVVCLVNFLGVVTHVDTPSCMFNGY